MTSTTALPTEGLLLFRTAYPPISRYNLVLYCAGSGDLNPIHVDADFARTFGYSDVFAHGMLIMAYLSRALTTALPLRGLRSYGVRFVSMTQVHAAITCEGRVDVVNTDYFRVKLSAMDELEDLKLTGAATFDAAAAVVGPDRVLAPKLLGVRPRPREEAVA